ncbi:Ankyrin repeat domain-containing protein 65 [Tetrabaena socialis]|uniref:Ankyrin repeat domain-containing protein 65 n=1 Tax=Tetrabaena socialis TaxID=47790 RepID=A0A2J8ACS0_9CHLO|nr:Ankyrin repeat domain-containing protein 65 [Tetrabaena socialis]|eukprot:PNH10312.1 Ankyrin repeat domain-containing protein 65 [Tetrabaena socialis]
MGLLGRRLVELQALAADTGVAVADVADVDRMLCGIDGGRATHQLVRDVEDGVVTDPRAVAAAVRAVAGWQAGGEAGGVGGQCAVANRLARRSGTLEASPAYDDIQALSKLPARPPAPKHMTKTAKALLTKIFDQADSTYAMAVSSSTADDLIAELKRDADKGELLLWASARGLSADVEELVRTGADPSVKDKHGRTAVHYAASSGHADILEYLSTKGVDMDAEDSVGRGALHYAAAGGHRECLVVLLAKGCWRDAPDAVDDSPLHLAARRGAMGAVRALAEAGAKLIVPNKRSLTPFAEAVLAGRVAAAEYLGDRAEGGLGAALSATYRAVPLLHLAAGLGGRWRFWGTLGHICLVASTW